MLQKILLRKGSLCRIIRGFVIGIISRCVLNELQGYS